MDAEELDRLADSYLPDPAASVRDQVSLYEMSSGEHGGIIGHHRAVILTTWSGSSDRLHKTPIPRIKSGGFYYGIVAPAGPGTRESAWYADVLIHPSVRIQDGPTIHTLCAREIGGADKVEWWSLWGDGQILEKVERGESRTNRLILFGPLDR